MSNTINGRTPEEIKRGLLQCSEDEDGCNCEGCPYDMGEFTCKCIPMNQKDALAYIQQLERERDAAVEQLKEMSGTPCENCERCRYCKHFAQCDYHFGECNDCINMSCQCIDCVNSSNWQWRGVQEVENNACQKGFDGLS